MITQGEGTGPAAVAEYRLQRGQAEPSRAVPDRTGPGRTGSDLPPSSCAERTIHYISLQGKVYTCHRLR